jgi:hypothetical protein
LIRSADWVIDLGAEDGRAGGQLIAADTPEQVAQVPASRTGGCLKSLLENDHVVSVEEGANRVEADRRDSALILS